MVTLAFPLLELGRPERHAGVGRGDQILAARVARPRRRLCFLCSQQFFPWYNTEHHHAGLGLLTPAVVHDGAAGAVVADPQVVLTAAYAAHPERFVRKPPTPPALPSTVWINAPGPTVLDVEVRQ